MRAMPITLGTIGYIVVTFPLAILWHLVLFGETCDDLGYITREEPGFVLGFLAIASQGLIMSLGCALWARPSATWRSTLILVAMFGAYHWTVHVLAEAAKHPIAPLPTWFALETVYLIVQFALFAGVLRLANWRLSVSSIGEGGA